MKLFPALLYRGITSKILRLVFNHGNTAVKIKLRLLKQFISFLIIDSVLQYMPFLLQNITFSLLPLLIFFSYLIEYGKIVLEKSEPNERSFYQKCKSEI